MKWNFRELEKSKNLIEYYKNRHFYNTLKLDHTFMTVSETIGRRHYSIHNKIGFICILLKMIHGHNEIN